ncbi:MAG: type II toxin-antitoxin system RelE/ParE family toxin [Planctomycetes bacterium]|nr:type II toxin-antitoxin system RelE/ParE family toxin [Planctomycetota bacterium]
MRQIELHPAAIEESRSAFLWYLERSIHAANAFMTELDRIVQSISNEPLIGTEFRPGLRKRQLNRYPFLVVYRELSNDCIEVVAVAHGRRRPGYWSERIG